MGKHELNTWTFTFKCAFFYFSLNHPMASTFIRRNAIVKYELGKDLENLVKSLFIPCLTND